MALSTFWWPCLLKADSTMLRLSLPIPKVANEQLQQGSFASAGVARHQVQVFSSPCYKGIQRLQGGLLLGCEGKDLPAGFSGGRLRSGITGNKCFSSIE